MGMSPENKALVNRFAESQVDRNIHDLQEADARVRQFCMGADYGYLLAAEVVHEQSDKITELQNLLLEALAKIEVKHE